MSYGISPSAVAVDGDDALNFVTERARDRLGGAGNLGV
jgi:hypothetical protein